MDELNLKSLPNKLNPLGEAKPKTLFSMMIPEVVEGLTKNAIQSVVIFGIEVGPGSIPASRSWLLIEPDLQSHVCVLQTALDCKALHMCACEAVLISSDRP